MIVRLNDSHQFGDDGPQRGALGYCHEIRLIDRDYWAYCQFVEFEDEGVYIVNLKHLMEPDTTNTETFYTTEWQDEPEG